MPDDEMKDKVTVMEDSMPAEPLLHSQGEFMPSTHEVKNILLINSWSFSAFVAVVTTDKLGLSLSTLAKAIDSSEL